MTKIILFTLAMSFTAAEAGTACSTDAFGNYNCTNYETGYKSTTMTDAYGNQQYQDNQGYTATCHTDTSGIYICS